MVVACVRPVEAGLFVGSVRLLYGRSVYVVLVFFVEASCAACAGWVAGLLFLARGYGMRGMRSHFSVLSWKRVHSVDEEWFGFQSARRRCTQEQER